MGTVVATGRKTREVGELGIVLVYVAACWGYVALLAGGWAARRALRRTTGRCVPDCRMYEECDRCGRRSARPRGPFTP